MSSKRGRAALAVGLCLLVLSACSPQGATSFFAPRSDQAYQLSLGPRRQLIDISYVQAIAGALNEPARLHDIYQSLVSGGMIGVSEADFSTYVEALRPDEAKQIESFTRLEASEEKTYGEQVQEKIPELADEAVEAHFYQLSCEADSRGRKQKIVVAVQQSGERPYLSPLWMRHAAKIYDFSKLYFQAIEARDEEALAWLLTQGQKPFQEGDLKRFASRKAERLLDFYSSHAVGQHLEQTLLSILPGEARYAQTYRLSELSTGTRYVSFWEKNGVVSVQEPIQEKLSEEESHLLIYDEPLLTHQLGSWQPLVTRASFNSQIGQILKIEALKSDDNNQANRRYHIAFYGLDLILRGTVSEDGQDFHGILEQMIFSSRIFSFGDNLRVGMPLADYYLRFPFAAESRYRVEATIEGQSSYLTLQSANDRVTQLLWLPRY